MRYAIYFFLFLLSLSNTHATTASDSLKIDSLVHSYIQKNGFSGTILVAKAGQSVFHRSYGLAYRSTPDTIQNDYHYSIASITKLFTSIRVLQLVQEGKISLDQPITDHLPQFANDISSAVTIHHLLLHLSGLASEKGSFYQRPMDKMSMIQHSLKRKSEAEFGQFNYNNVDYLLLGLLIEKVSGSTWQDNIRTHLLEPLGLEETGFLTYGRYPKDFAYTYRKRRGKWKQDPLFHIENFNAAACMYSTSLDLLKLDQALYTDQLLNAQSKAHLSKSYPEYNYAGYGVWNYAYPFVDTQPTIMERRGGILGANVVLVRMLDDNYTIVILSNDHRFDPDSFGDPENLRELLIQSLY